MNTMPCLQGEVALKCPSAKPRPARSRAFALLATLLFLAFGSSPTQARVIYVNGQLQPNPIPDGNTWATAWNSIGDALNEASEGDEIWVAQGTYKEFVTITNGVALYGGFAGTETDRDQRNFTWNTTTIYGDGGGFHLNRNVVGILEATNDFARLDGFTIAKDTIVLGSAIFTSNGSPVIANNRVCDFAKIPNGIIWCQNGSPLITNNCIFNNQSVGIYCTNSAAHITRNRIVGNSTQHGAGIKIEYGSPLIDFNDLVGNYSEDYSGGIDCRFATVNVLNNRIIGNFINSTVNFPVGVGIAAASCTNILIANNLVLGNINSKEVSNAYGESAGILCDQYVSGTIINNTLIRNQGCQAGGLWCESTQVVILNNIIAFNSSGVGGATNMLFTNNCVYANGTTNFVKLPDPTGTNGNISIDPQLDGDEESPGWHLLPGSPCINAGNISWVSSDWRDIDGEPRLRKSQVDIGADAFQDGYAAPLPVIYHISPTGDDRNDGLTWATAISRVQTALERSFLARKEVWVAAGTYSECIDMSPYTSLYGGFSGVETNRNQRNFNRNITVLDGQTLGSVVQINCLPGKSRLDGFTIQNGFAINGGGIYSKYSSPVIANNIIQNNTVNIYAGKPCMGGGIYSESSALVLSNNFIQNNTASCGGGVAMVRDRGDSVVRNSFKSNRALLSLNISSMQGGGGLAAIQSRTKIRNNAFLLNISTNQTSVPSMYQTGHGGAIFFWEGIMNDSGTNEISNNTLIGNQTFRCAEAGGIALMACNNTLCANNLLAYNSSGLFIQSNSNIQWLNNCVSSNILFNYSGIRNQTGTNGNISANPAFALPAQPYLLSNSPCIDAGTTRPEATNELDWAGNPRLIANAVDIGAVEFSSQLPALTSLVYFVSTNGSDTNSGRSWLNAKRTVQGAIDSVAADGGEIWVAAGKYVENLTLRPFVSLYGGFKGDEANRNDRDWNKNETVLDGAVKNSVITVLPSGDDSTVSGFTIQNGGRIGNGGGIYCTYSSLRISENRIIRNASMSCAGIFSTNGAPVIMNNLIAFNTNSGALAGVDVGTISFMASPSSKLIGNTIVSNKVDTFYGAAGAVYTSNGGLIINNIIAFNNCVGLELGKYSYDNPAIILSNNCVYGNPCSNYLHLGSFPEGPIPGSKDISVDPLFIPGTSQLSATSPCIDAGNDLVITPDMMDLAGTVRIQGTHVDIGAYEYAAAGDWVSFVPGGEALAVAPVTVGSITYIPWRFEFAESKYRMTDPETFESNGTNFTGRFHLQQWTGTEKPGTNAFSGTFVLGALNPGDYAFAVNVSSNEFKTVPFSVPTERTPTLTWQPRTEGALKLQVAGVADVTYRLLCATNLADWTILSTHRGAPFELDVTNNPDIPTLFYRVEIVK